MIKFYKLKKTIHFLKLISLLLLGFSNARAALSNGDQTLIAINSDVDFADSNISRFASVVINDIAAFLVSIAYACVSDS